MSGTVTNIAKGNARVGVQAGTVHGGIVQGHHWQADSAGIPAQLADLREKLAKARADGDMDGDTFAAAEQELDTIAEALPSAGEKASPHVMIALSRLRGLLMDWAELAAKVTAVIAALRGTS